MYVEPGGAAAAAGEQDGSPQQQATPDAKPGSSAGQEADKDDLSKLTVAQLKERLRERGLPVSGVKVCARMCMHELRVHKGALQDERSIAGMVSTCLPVLGVDLVPGCTTGAACVHCSDGAQAFVGSVCGGSLWRSSRGYYRPGPASSRPR